MENREIKYILNQCTYIMGSYQVGQQAVPPMVLSGLINIINAVVNKIKE